MSDTVRYDDQTPRLFFLAAIVWCVVALLLSKPGSKGAGIELYVMLAGVVATVSFLLLQAHLRRRERSAEGAA